MVFFIIRKICWNKLLFEEVSHISNLIFSRDNEETLKNNKKLSKSEEQQYLNKFNKLILSTSKKWQINSTILFSKKNQRDFFKLLLKSDLDFCLSTLPEWKVNLLENHFREIFKQLLEEWIYLFGLFIWWQVYLFLLF